MTILKQPDWNFILLLKMFSWGKYRKYNLLRVLRHAYRKYSKDGYLICFNRRQNYFIKLLFLIEIIEEINGRELWPQESEEQKLHTLLPLLKG